jgi:isopentenyl-diphosphate Delta-isomerase
MSRPKVAILDTATDQIVGEMDKLQAHVEGRYHAAISVLLCRSDGLQLVQRRAVDKYHSGGLWANACCGHQKLGENAGDAVSRRLYEELGVLIPLSHIGVIRYRAHVRGPDGGHLMEHERVDLFTGLHDGDVNFNPAEASEIRWVSRDCRELTGAAELAAWFKLYMDVIGLEPRKADGRTIDFGYFDLAS